MEDPLIHRASLVFLALAKPGKIERARVRTVLIVCSGADTSYRTLVFSEGLDLHTHAVPIEYLLCTVSQVAKSEWYVTLVQETWK
jgi:hypothetical protein